MALYLAEGSPTTRLDETAIREALRSVFAQLGERRRVIAVPPDFTRYESRAGWITSVVYEHFGSALVDVLPALGTHFALEDGQRNKMFPGVPPELFRVHRWRDDVLTLGEVPAAFVSLATEGIFAKPWPVQLNKLLWEGGHDLILSIGQVVPHEVSGMANYNKNLFVGTGGPGGINQSHFIGAVYGMERMMGRSDTPLRRILNYAQDNFCGHLPLLFVLTVIGPEAGGGWVVRGLFVGDDHECFERACELSQQVNITKLDASAAKIVVYLDEDEFRSTWLGNKAIYRTRMAMADGGELVVLAPGVRTFGEDPEIDRLIRKYGYRTTPEILAAVEANEELQANLAAAAHLIHGSSEGRFSITYCPGHLSREEIEGVGYRYGDLAELLGRYSPGQLREGRNILPDGEEIYFVRKPALGLWANAAHFSA